MAYIKKDDAFIEHLKAFHDASMEFSAYFGSDAMHEDRLQKHYGVMHVDVDVEKLIALKWRTIRAMNNIQKCTVTNGQPLETEEKKWMQHNGYTPEDAF